MIRVKDIRVKIRYLFLGLVLFLSIFFYQSSSFIPTFQDKYYQTNDFGRVKLQRLSTSSSLLQTTTITSNTRYQINQDEILNRECQYIDAVYIWLDESDSNYLKKRKEEGFELDRNNTNDYRQLDQLKYSLRSLDTYAPWIQNIWIISDDQIPSWYHSNENNQKLQFISLEVLYSNRSHLPTFNRLSIESNLYNLPEQVSNCFLYFNENVVLKSPVNPTDFFDENFNQVLFESDNVFESTLYDNLIEKGTIDDFYKSLLVSGRLLDKAWVSDNDNKDNRIHLFNSVIERGVYTFNRKILIEMSNELDQQLQQISSQKVKLSTTDIHIPFIYNQYVKKLSSNSNNNNSNNSKYQYKVTNGFNFYGELSELSTLQDAKETESKVLCLNNNLNPLDEFYNQDVEQILKYYNSIFVDPSPWEK
ncbi:hypothetical protein CYY_005634 [Polysphondylium violaceum]|uniref:Stealth protein CR2 conserved region 2 domain-containing protein n=1 Tax=Polysphondylium violaceum TaxID=133409 RepID=A0A8J4US18_9MYCE|nr:hypothetical protein CYY_005634 [Polysphondylium violaceum]